MNFIRISFLLNVNLKKNILPDATNICIYIIYIRDLLFQVEFPRMENADWSDVNLWISMATIIFNPLYWNVVSINYTHLFYIIPFIYFD